MEDMTKMMFRLRKEATDYYPSCSLAFIHNKNDET